MKDWSFALLNEIRRLAFATPKDWKKAKAMLKEVVRRVHELDHTAQAAGQPKLSAKMVQIAIKIQKAEESVHTPQKSNEPVTRPQHRQNTVSTRTFAASPTPGPSNSQPTPPQSPRSETIVPEVINAAPITPAAPMVPGMQTFAHAAAPLPSPEMRPEEPTLIIEQCMDELEDLRDSDAWHKKQLEANEIRRRRIERKLRNSGKGYALSASQMPI